MNKLISNQDRNHNVLDTENIGRLLLKLTTPVFFAMFVQTLYNLLNTVFLGHTEDGTLAIAGLSVIFPVQMLMMGLGMMVGIGGTSVISRALGAGDNSKAERTLGNGLTSIVIISVAAAVIVIPNVNYILPVIGASDDVLPYARDYLVIITGGNLFNATGIVLLNYARAEGNARVGMISQIIAAILVIILSAIFIFGMNMGVKGAALATVTGQIAALIYISFFYLSRSSYLKIHTRNLRLDFKILKPMFSIGISAFVQTVATSISAMYLIKSVVFYGGDVALSAFGIAQRVMMFITLPAMSIGQGAQPILGFNYGAKRYFLVLKTLRIAAIYSTLVSVLAFILIIIFPGAIIRIFSADPELIEIGIRVCKLTFLAMPLIGVIMLGASAIQSFGKAAQAFILAFVRPVVFLVPMVFILPRFLHIDGVFLSLPASDVLTVILTAILIFPLIRDFQKAVTAEKQHNADTITNY